MTTEADVALACIRAFADGLVAAGVRTASVSPGSRSTPLALAVARDPRVRVFVHIDERSAAFFALGLAKASGAPVAVVCTSGTAAANLFPAVVEASMARVPLVLLTADRPPELRGVGANQTIDQIELFGRHVRSFVDAPVPGDEPYIDEWRLRGLAVARTSLASPPGPVHVNLPFREPLVPSPAGAIRHDGVPDETEDAPTMTPSSTEFGPVVELLSTAERGLVYAGGLRSGGDDVVGIARAIGWPLVAEPHSGARRPGALPAGQLLIASERFADEHVPDVVLQIGAAPTSRAALALVGRAGRLAILDPDDVVGDPLRHASARVVAPPVTLRSALEGVEPRPAERWATRWREASDRVRAAVDDLLDTWDEPFEGRVARDVLGALADGSDLCVGSSMPIRDVDLYMRPRDGVRILANRGASGIDGFVSTTLGVSAGGRPTVALLGDLTMLHDVGALVWNARRGFDAVLVVANNGGGAIFSLLEQSSLPEIDELFTTPHGVDLGALARASGAGHRRVDRAIDLIPALEASCRAGGVHVLDVVVDAARDRARRHQIRRVVEGTLR